MGDWVELISERGNKRALRLTWISGYKTVYLFTNRFGEEPFYIPAIRLADRLRDGTARVLSKERISAAQMADLIDASAQEKEE